MSRHFIFNSMLLFIMSITCTALTAQAAPTLLDSIDQSQLGGIKASSISSIDVQNGNLLITDESNIVYQWKHGKPPSVFQTGNDKQRFSSAVYNGQDKQILIDTRNANFLVSNKTNWDIFATSGTMEGEIKKPIAATLSKHGILYIADAGNNRISAFNEDGLFLFTFGNQEVDSTKNIDQILSIATDRTGRVYVLDETGGGRVSIYTALGELETSIGKTEFTSLLTDSPRLTSMTVRSDGILILSDRRSGRILELDWENMKVISSFGTNGRGRGQFQRVTSLTLDHDGKLYIADRGNEKIEVFQTDWLNQQWLSLDEDKLSVRPSSVLMSACDVSYIYGPEHFLCLNSKDDSVSIRSHDGASLQTLNAKFSKPIRAVFDQNEILVLDDDNVKVFDNKGVFKFNFGSKGRRDGDFSDATDLELTPTSVYISDTGNRRIQVFSRNGLYQKTIGNDKADADILQQPVAVAVNQHGNTYVADGDLNRVFVYSEKGKLITQIGFPKDHAHEFLHIHDIMTGKDNILYVMTSIANNPLTIWVYKDAQYIYRFSPTKQAPEAGFDQQWSSATLNKKNKTVEELTSSATKALDSTVKLSLDLTLTPILELFTGAGGLFGSNESWIFNPIQNNSSVLAVVDLGQHARHTFTLAYPPKQVRDIAIDGDEKNIELKWLAESENFSGYYTIYGRKDISSRFKIVTKTLHPYARFKRSEFEATEYRVSASSPLGKEGKLSSVYQDEFWLGYLAYQQGDFEKALHMLNEATVTNPEHASAWLYLGKAQAALQNFDKASFAFAQLGLFEKWQQTALHLQAETLMQKQTWLDVKALVDKAENDKTADAVLYNFAAQALIKMDDIPSAMYYLNQAIAKEPTSSTWHLALADANYYLGASADDKAELLKAIKLAGNDVQAWVSIAQAYSRRKLYSESISHYIHALKLDPEHAQALPELAMLYLQTKQTNEARSLATRMAGIPALKSTSYYIFGLVSLAEKKAPQALAMLAQAGQADPNNADIWLSMANAYAALNQGDRENEYLQKAAALDDSNFSIHMRLAQMCMTKQDTDCAREHFTQATTIDSKNIDAQLGLAKTLLASGKMSTANEYALAALKLQPSSIAAHLTLADIQNARGMIPESIATLKQALNIESNNMDVHLSLSKAYIANHMYAEATAISEKAILLDVSNAEPLMLNGSIYLARQSFDEAISIFEKAIKLAPDNIQYRQQLSLAYLQKKRSVDAGGNILGPKLKQLEFSRVFAAAYKQYTESSIGKLTLSNQAGIDFTNLKLSLFVKEYMDFPTTMVIERVPAGGEVEVPLYAAFNNKILGIDEDTGVQTEVRVEYYLAGQPHTETLNESMTIYGKNAIVWDKLDMVGSFTTPKDNTLAVFIRQLVNSYNPKADAVNANVSKAMTVYNGLSAYGIQYLVDPNTPYNKLGAQQLDTIQFPRETLQQRSGDCDDLSVLLAASLSNLGMETAILDVPQHLLMMFNTGVAEADKNSISLNDEALAILDGQVWIPLEATLIHSSFTEAWAEGARKYHLYGKQRTMTIMPLATAWENYPPVTLPPADYTLSIPDPSAIGDKISKESEILSVKALERQVKPYRIMLALDAKNEQAQMQIAVVFARNGLYKQATIELEAIRAKNPANIAALNNLGNIHYMLGDYKNALLMYKQATELEPNNPNILVNIAMVNYKMGDALEAKTYFDRATEIDDQVPNRYNQLAFLLHQ